jgi:exodeoxyribonuclease VII large subunit
MAHFFYNTDESSRVYSVAAVNANVRSLLEERWSGICVEGEVGDVTRAQSGHIYFTLIDRDGRAQLSAVMWRGRAVRYGARIVTGARIRCFGRLTLYEARGSFQMAADSAEEAGAGQKAEKLEALKKKLFEEGLFDRERKKKLPAFPSTVGIVTSRQGAAFRDIAKVARRRFPVRLLIAHAQVQGEGAAEEIVSGLKRLEAREEVDVIIVGRGGGSSEDLDAFNVEAVVRAVAACTKPVISAVGHEIDTSLTDLAADRRAATPSEAAEIVVPDSRALKERIAQTGDGLVAAMSRLCTENNHVLTSLTGRARAQDPRVRLHRGAEIIARSREVLLRVPSNLLAQSAASLSRAGTPLARWPEPRILKARASLAKLDDALCGLGERLPRSAEAAFAKQVARLEALSPLASLSRGYAVVKRLPDGRILRRAADAPEGTDVDITLADGSLRCRVTGSTS